MGDGSKPTSGPSRPQKVRHEPRFSLNDLLRYMDADTAAQRGRIIYQQKYPPDFLVMYYEAACDAIAAFIAGGRVNESLLHSAIQRLESDMSSAGSDQAMTRISSNIEAIEAALNSYEVLELSGLDPSLGDNNCPKLMLNGLELSVRPEVILKGRHKDAEAVGAIKLYFSKGEPLSNRMADYGAAVTYRLVNEKLASGRVTKPAFCMIYDVFGGTSRPSPIHITQRFKDMDATATEVVVRWPTI